PSARWFFIAELPQRRAAGGTSSASPNATTGSRSTKSARNHKCILRNRFTSGKVSANPSGRLRRSTMSRKQRSTHVSEAPTNPVPQPVRKTFDVADLYRGPVAQVEADGAAQVALDEKLRQAYFWIVNHAVISPHYDIEYNDGPCQTFTFGGPANKVNLP